MAMMSRERKIALFIAEVGFENVLAYLRRHYPLEFTPPPRTPTVSPPPKEEKPPTEPEEKPGKPAKVKIANWLATKENIPIYMTGEIKAETVKAVLFSGRGYIEAATHCLRCDRPLTHPISLQVGYGPTCSEKLGIPWIETEDQIPAFKEKVEKITYEGWIPKSQSTIIYLEGSED